MGEKSKISWTHNTFNPWWGCQRVSPACEHCYAESFATVRMGLPIWGPKAERRLFTDKHWTEPLKWNKAATKAGERRRVFCASMADVFESRPELVEPSEHGHPAVVQWVRRPVRGCVYPSDLQPAEIAARYWIVRAVSTLNGAHLTLSRSGWSETGKPDIFRSLREGHEKEEMENTSRVANQRTVRVTRWRAVKP